jgi:hypothetical protein
LGKTATLKIENISRFSPANNKTGTAKIDWKRKVKTALALGLKAFFELSKYCCVSSAVASAETESKVRINQVICLCN